MNIQREKSIKVLNVWLCSCMFFSGLSALIYEIAWLRLLSLTLGNTAYATSCALAVFLLGLSIGAYLGGRLADSLSLRPLRLYAIAELGIGLSAAIISQALVAAPTIILGSTTNGTLMQLDPVLIVAIVSCFLLLIPTIFMGATLPLILKQIGEYALPQKSFGHIYGLNTLGAVFGGLLAAFVGFSYLGIYGTILVAVLINLTIALVSLIFSKRLLPPSQLKLTNQPSLQADISGTDELSGASFPLGLVCLLAFSSGYASLTFEVVWVRILRFFNYSVTYTFTIMLSTFLLGLALGSLIYEKLIETKDKTVSDKLLRFANLQYLAAITSGGCLIGIPVCILMDTHSNVLANPMDSLFKLLLNSLICILLPATLLGTLFPLLGTIAASSREKHFSSKVGIVYAINTLGCVLGALISGLILIPYVGSYDAFQLAILLGVICASIAVLKQRTLARSKKLALAFIPVIAAISFYLFVKVPFYCFFPKIGGDRVLFYGEDLIGTIFVWQFSDWDAKQLIVNGSTFATTILPGRRYMRMLGHLPVLLHPNPQNVMIACFGTGTTSGAVSVYPEVKHLDIVELSKMIIKVGSFFSNSNHNVLNNSKTRVHLGDARHFLLSSKADYDIISMEPPPPLEAGVVNLYTTEFYRLVSKHLNDNGIFAQWVSINEAPAPLWKMMLQSALKVFPYTSIWLPTSGQAILIASKSPIQFDCASVRSRMSKSKTVQASLKEIGFDDPEAILSTYTISDNRLRQLVGNVPDVSDDRPALEFFLPYTGQFLQNKDLLKYSDSGIPDIVRQPADVNLGNWERHRRALILMLTMNPALSKDKRMQVFDQIDQLEPGNNFYPFLRRLSLATDHKT